MIVNYKVVQASQKYARPIGSFRYTEFYRMFNYKMLEQFDDPAYIVLYTYLAQTKIFKKNASPSQLIYQRLGNLPADPDMQLHIEGALRMQRMVGHEKYMSTNTYPSTANYTFVHPELLYATNINVETTARYIRAVKNIRLSRRIEGGKLIVPAEYVEDWVNGIPGITQNKEKNKIRFNLEETIKVIKEY